VLVIGGGVIGAASAFWLERAGCAVTVVERRAELGSLTTPNALGTIRTQYGTRLLISMAQESLEFYRNVETFLGVTPSHLDWANNGYLYLTDNPDHCQKLLESLTEYEELGVTSSSFVDADAIRQRFPFAGKAVGGIFHADGSWLDPAKVTGAWVGATNNVEWRTGTEVFDLTRSASGWKVITSAGDLQADVVVICSGPYGPGLLAQLGVDIPVKITPRYKAFIPDTGPEHATAPLVINIANGAYWRPIQGGVWLSHSNVDGRSFPPAESVTIPAEFLDQCIKQIEPVSPQLAATAQANRDLVTYSGGFQVYPADDAPIIGAVPDAEDLFMNTGHWAGVMLAPASGRLLADLVVGNVSERDNPCRLGRFVEGTVSAHGTNKFGGWG
jgi:sarcosine oxidase subunit beta